MRAVAFFLYWLSQLFVLCLIGRAVLSWFPLGYDSVWARLNKALVRITEPVIRPVRRLVGPVSFGGVGIDLSFLIVLLVIELVAQPLLRSYASSY